MGVGGEQGQDTRERRWTFLGLGLLVSSHAAWVASGLESGKGSVECLFQVD